MRHCGYRAGQRVACRFCCHGCRINERSVPWPLRSRMGPSISVGPPSPELAPLFADPEKVARWFRACAWKTDSAYARDAFPVNALGRDFLEACITTRGEQLAQALAEFGRLEQVTPELHVWSIASEERQQAASDAGH